MGLRVAPSIFIFPELSYSCIDNEPKLPPAECSVAAKIQTWNNTEDKMQIRNWTSGRRIDKWKIGSFCYLVVFYLLSFSIALQAQSSSVQTGPTGSKPSVPDLAIAGTIRQVITPNAAGAPPGIQVVVDAPQGSFTASLGPNLSRDVQQSLSSGSPVQISGAMQAIDGKEYLLARTLTIAGNQVVIRNAYGFLVHTPSRSRAAGTNSALYRSAK
jgi:hypothetical protein